jgi:hypothetical protein
VRQFGPCIFYIQVINPVIERCAVILVALFLQNLLKAFYPSASLVSINQGRLIASIALPIVGRGKKWILKLICALVSVIQKPLISGI